MRDEKRETAAIAPADEAALAELWNRCHETGEHAAAIEALGKAIAADAGVARYHYMLGCSLQDAARTAEAAAAYRQAVALDPGLAKAHNNLGCLLEVAGDAAGAMQCYEAALRVEPGMANARNNLENLRNPPLRLHIGGEQKKLGWKILNIQPGADVDFVGDCTELGQFADASVDALYASHVLEHVGYQTALPRTLAEFHRVLKPGGMAMIGVPDFEILCRLFLDPRATTQDRFYVMRMTFGGQTDAHDFHCVGLSHEFLSRYLFKAGFSRVERVTDFGLFSDSSTNEYLGEKVSLNVVAYK